MQVRYSCVSVSELFIPHDIVLTDFCTDLTRYQKPNCSTWRYEKSSTGVSTEQTPGNI